MISNFVPQETLKEKINGSGDTLIEKIQSIYSGSRARLFTSFLTQLLSATTKKSRKLKKHGTRPNCLEDVWKFIKDQGVSSQHSFGFIVLVFIDAVRSCLSSRDENSLYSSMLSIAFSSETAYNYEEGTWRA
eukprot:gb/GECH01010681.1/.p1 GENE.gb/GECH01010681.1/~~gb/GECH01010681.1/.p1  ORF type:complete len:132 (+),score=11.57 gb/GECH01010681.1/:1-396(+)